MCEFEKRFALLDCCQLVMQAMLKLVSCSTAARFAIEPRAGLFSSLRCVFAVCAAIFRKQNCKKETRTRKKIQRSNESIQ